MTIISPICMECKSYWEYKYSADIFGGFKCMAFPEGIPKAIVMGDNNHSEPLPEQKNAIVFEKLKD